VVENKRESLESKLADMLADICYIFGFVNFWCSSTFQKGGGGLCQKGRQVWSVWLQSRGGI